MRGFCHTLVGEAQLTDFVATTTTTPGATTTTVVTTTTSGPVTTTTLVPPCGDAASPACIGTCPDGFLCSFNPIAMVCSCVAL